MNANQQTTPEARRCGTCQWWKPQLTTTGKPNKLKPGKCGYIIFLAAMPFCVRLTADQYTSCWHDTGKDCPTWQPKTT